MKKQIFGFFLPVVGVFAIASPASALTALSSQTLTYSLSPGSSLSQSVTLNQLNPSIGILNSVSLEFTGSTNFLLDGYNLSGTDNPGSITAADQTSTVQFSTIPDSIYTLASGDSSASSSLPVSFDLPSGTFGSVVATVSGSSFDVTQNVTSYLADFVGTGNVGLSITAAQPNITASLTNPNVGDYTDTDLSTAANGSVIVTYNYTPVPFDISANELVFFLVPLFIGIRVIKKKMAI